MGTSEIERDGGVGGGGWGGVMLQIELKLKGGQILQKTQMGEIT